MSPFLGLPTMPVLQIDQRERVMFEWPDEMQMIRDAVRQFVDNEEAPQAPPPPPPPASASQGRERERSPLSQREREIVALVAQGFRNKEMAEKMFISEQTVKNHLHNIFDKLGVSDRLELALYAIHNNLHTGR